MAALQGLREGISGLLHPTDRLVRIGHEDFLVVLPSWPNDEVLRFTDEVCARISAARPGLSVRRAARRRRGHRDAGSARCRWTRLAHEVAA